MAASIAVIDLHAPDRDVIGADLGIGDLDIGDDPRFVVQNDIGVDDRRSDRELRGAGQHDIVRAHVDRRRLILPLAAQPHEPAQSLSRGVEPSLERTGGSLHQPAVESDTRQVAALDVDRQRPRRGQQHDVGGQRAIIGVAGRREAIAVRGAVDLRDQIGQPDTQSRPVGGHDRARIADRPRKLNPDRTIVGRIRPRGELDLPVRRIAALPAGHAQSRRGEPQVGEADDAVGAIADIAARHRIAAQKIADPRIEQPRRPRAHLADDLEPAARRGFQIGVGVDVEQPDTFDAIVIDPPVDRPGVKTLVEIGDHDRLGIDARRPQAQIVAEDTSVLIGEIAVEPSELRNAVGKITPTIAPYGA